MSEHATNQADAAPSHHREGAARSRPVPIWWLRPDVVGIGWAALVLASAAVPEAAYGDFVGAPKALDAGSTTVLVVVSLAFAVGAFIGDRVLPSSSATVTRSDDAWSFLDQPRVGRLLLAALTVCAAAYFVWFEPTLRPSVWAEIFGGDPNSFRRGRQIAGITSFSQVGIFIAIVSLVSLRLQPQGSTASKKLRTAAIAIVVVLALYRSVAWSERLAIVEVIVPLIVVEVSFGSHKSWRRPVYQAAPILGAIGLGVLFGIFEYFRSWSAYRDQYTFYPSFVFDRLSAYYYTSFNNWALYDANASPLGEPYHLFHWAYHLPASPLSDRATSIDADLLRILDEHGDAEFNLFSAAGSVLIDLGAFGAATATLALGILAGRLYRSWRQGSIGGLLVYPFFFVGLADFGRTLYWTSSRAFIPWIALTITVVWARRGRRGKSLE